jgi:hypothetical protein
MEPVPGMFVSVSGALAEFLKAAFPGQGAGQVHPGGFMAEVSQHAHGIHPRRACPACRIEDQLPRVGIGRLEKFPKLLVQVTLDETPDQLTQGVVAGAVRNAVPQLLEQVMAGQ